MTSKVSFSIFRRIVPLSQMTFMSPKYQVCDAAMHILLSSLFCIAGCGHWILSGKNTIFFHFSIQM